MTEPPTYPLDPFDLTGRVAIVTGAGRGLGLAMARALGRKGARVYLNGRDTVKLAEAARGLVAEGLDTRPLPFDVADAKAATSAVDQVAHAEGRFDILINNVGQRLRAPVEDISPAAFDALLQVNVGAAYALAQAAAPHMIRGGYGRIVMLSSTAGTRARAGDVAYIAAKGAIDALTRALACEWGPRGVHCNTIAPGPFATETNAAFFADPAMIALIRSRSPLARYGDPEEIGGACVFLASPASSYVNGVVLAVDGGISISA